MKFFTVIITLVILSLGMVTALGAQSVEVREISVKKNRPDEIYHRAATKVTFWINDNEGDFNSIVLEDSYLEVFEDDKGTNLIAAHDEAISAWEDKVESLAKKGHYVGFDRTQEFFKPDKFDWDDDVPGFYLDVESWAVPAKGAQTLHIAGKVCYMVALSEVNMEVFSEFILGETKSFRIGENEIRLSDYEDYGDFYNFTLYSDTPLTDIVISNGTEEWIGGVSYTMNGDPVMEIYKEYWNTPVKLEVSYRNLKKLSVSFDETVGLGF